MTLSGQNRREVPLIYDWKNGFEQGCGSGFRFAGSGSVYREKYGYESGADLKKLDLTKKTGFFLLLGEKKFPVGKKNFSVRKNCPMNKKSYSKLDPDL